MHVKEVEAGWNMPPKKKFKWEGFIIEMVVVIVILILGGFFYNEYHKQKQKLKETYSISLPPGSKDSISGYPGEYITVTFNPRTGPYCLTRGIWLIEVADRSGEGLFVLRGYQTDEAGVTTRVTVTSTTNHFVENNSGIGFTVISKGSPNFNATAAAFKGNDFVAKDPK